MQRSENATVYFVLGGPGAGKGSACIAAAEAGLAVHLSAGDLLRAERNSGSVNGELIQKHIREGTIVPASVTIALLRTAMQNAGWNEKIFLIDGFPRNTENYYAWKEMCTDVDAKFLLHFVCPDEICIERILGRDEGRVDDNIDAAKRRIEVYKTETMVVINEFEAEGKVRVIQAEKSIQDTYDQLLQFLPTY